MAAQRRRPAGEPRPRLAGLERPEEYGPLTRAQAPEPSKTMARRGRARATPATAPIREATPARGEMQLGPGEILLSLPAALGVGQMLMDKSMDAAPWVVGWVGVVVAYRAITAPGVRRGSLDWLVDSLNLGPDLRRRLGVPDELPRIVPPPRTRGAWGLLDGLTADWRNLQAAVAARRGEVVEGAWTRAQVPPTPRRAPPPPPLVGADALDEEGGDEGEAVLDIGLPTVRLEAIADLDNLWIVGPKGSGKTTLVKRLIGMRHGQHIALDPHGTPGKWPGCEMVGAGRDFGAIDRQIARFISWMDGRYKKMAAGEATEDECKAVRRTMVGDEWRAIRTALPGAKAVRGGKEQPSASARLLDILTEGRKAGICVLTASHLDTAEGMGITGEKDILKCFDLIIYLGAMATKHVPAAAAMARPAVVFDPEHNAWAQLVIGHITDAPEPPVVDRALLGLVPCDRCGEPTPRAGRHCITCGVAQHSGGDTTAKLAAPPKRERQAGAAPNSEPDPLFAELLARDAGPAPAPLVDLSLVSPNRAQRLAAILERQQAPSPAPEAAPGAVSPEGPTANQSVTVDQPGGGQVVVNVQQVAPQVTRQTRGRHKGSFNARQRRARADEYHKVRAVIARGGSANEARREAQLGRDKALAYARQARAELGLTPGPGEAS